MNNDKAKDSLVIVAHTEINLDLTGGLTQLNLSPEASAFTELVNMAQFYQMYTI
jgi:hypothetical protein